MTIHHLGTALWSVTAPTAHIIVGDGKPREWKELARSQSRVEVPMVLWCDFHAEKIQCHCSLCGAGSNETCQEWDPCIQLLQVGGRE